MTSSRDRILLKVILRNGSTKEVDYRIARHRSEDLVVKFLLRERKRLAFYGRTTFPNVKEAQKRVKVRFF